MIRLKLDENPLQRRIYFLTFIDSLNMVFYQYRETYEVLRYYQKTEGGNIKVYAKMDIRNLLHANSCVHSRRLIAEFPEDGIKCMENLQHIVQICVRFYREGQKIFEKFISFSILGKNHIKSVNKGEKINPTLEWILIQFESDDF